MLFRPKHSKLLQLKIYFYFIPHCDSRSFCHTVISFCPMKGQIAALFPLGPLTVIMHLLSRHLVTGGWCQSRHVTQGWCHSTLPSAGAATQEPSQQSHIPFPKCFFEAKPHCSIVASTSSVEALW